MAEVTRSRTVAAEPAEVWQVLADFGALSTWADGVDHSCLLRHSDDPVGTTRRVQAGHETFAETIVAYDPPRELAYDIAGVPRWFSATNRWNLRPAPGGRTTVTLTSVVRMRPNPLHAIAEPTFARMMAKRSEELLNSLAQHVERHAARHPERTR